MNCVVISGNLTKDIEMRLTPGGVSTCSFTVAVRRGYKNADGGYDTDFKRRRVRICRRTGWLV